MKKNKVYPSFWLAKWPSKDHLP